MSRQIFNALIRTHHITSRKKIQRLKKAASQHDVVFVLIRSGGSPGMMYVESNSEASVTKWVSDVQALRYKDYHCVSKPSIAEIMDTVTSPGFKEVVSVAAFAEEMKLRGLTAWWRKAMNYGIVEYSNESNKT